MDEPMLLTVSQAAKVANIGRSTAYELCASGTWPVVRIGRAVRVHFAQLRQWIDAQTHTESARMDR